MMLTPVLLLFSLLLPREGAQEKAKPVPKDSVELVVIGCLTGRVLAVSDVRQTDTQSGPIVKARSFRLAAKKDVMEKIKDENHHLVEVTGIVRRSALTEPGVNVGKGITFGGGPPVAGNGGRPVTTDYIPVMDVDSVRLRSTEGCGGM